MQNVKNKGLTLIEVLIAMGIAIIAGTLLLVVIVNTTGLFYNQSAKVSQGLNINDTLAVVRSSIKQASSVAVSYTDGPTTYTSGPDQLVLKVSSVDSSGNLVSDTYDNFVFFLDLDILHFKVFPNPISSRNPVDRILSTTADNLNFAYFDSANPPVEVIPTSAARIKITLTLKQKAGTSFETSVVTSEANLRND
ncbi:type II secretion system protein [Candidatus Daviesbacteria bacterium]|nr:type II secretion system protein [Candidatus Daviesbacteria bacterium]